MKATFTFIYKIYYRKQSVLAQLPFHPQLMLAVSVGWNLGLALLIAARMLVLMLMVLSEMATW